eukprot:TRINITY_DN24157_c0_g1_i1.p2 TRINITY_DN24157_c0_g1~~TRINITY_DN24157_c0_g1_i1.p2  ORF type:complete len:130 (+),score=18.35 TRINITY_DN24157_c0_g1_i1:744-1133(+)
MAPRECRNHRALSEDACTLRVARMIRAVLLASGCFQADAASSVTDLHFHHVVTLQSADVEVDVSVNLADVILEVEARHVVDFEATLSDDGHAVVAADGDPMVALENIQQDVLCGCLMYSDSESGDNSLM